MSGVARDGLKSVNAKSPLNSPLFLLWHGNPGRKAYYSLSYLSPLPFLLAHNRNYTDEGTNVVADCKKRALPQESNMALRILYFLRYSRPDRRKISRSVVIVSSSFMYDVYPGSLATICRHSRFRIISFEISLASWLSSVMGSHTTLIYKLWASASVTDGFGATVGKFTC